MHSVHESMLRAKISKQLRKKEKKRLTIKKIKDSKIH